MTTKNATNMLTIQLPATLKRRLRVAAASADCSASEVARQAIMREVERLERKTRKGK